MLDFIRSIVGEVGGRIPGSPEELRAQEMVYADFAQFCDRVERHHFSAAMTAKFGSLKFFTLVFVLLFPLQLQMPVLAASLALLNVVLFIGHFVAYRDWLDFLFQKSDSLNVIGTIEPEGEVKVSILLSGHIDSVHEFRWWYLLKNLGGFLSMFCGLAMLMQAVLFLLSLTWTHSAIYQDLIFYLACTSPLQIVLFSIQSNRKVDGAIDNLTGVATAREVGKAIAANRLKHTRVQVISFGAEEAGLKGAAAYARDYREELLKEGAVLINIDSIKDDKHLTLLRGEMNLPVRYPKELVQAVSDSFHACQVEFSKATLTLGASDGAAFALKGLPAVTIVGLNTAKLDPTYHTRLDTVDAIDPVGMEKLVSVLTHFIREIDKKEEAIQKRF